MVQPKKNSESVNDSFKQTARLKALLSAPTIKSATDEVGNKENIYLSASEITVEAEKIYQWLIKDL